MQDIKHLVRYNVIVSRRSSEFSDQFLRVMMSNLVILIILGLLEKNTAFKLVFPSFCHPGKQFLSFIVFYHLEEGPNVIEERPGQEDVDDGENDEAENVQGETAELLSLSHSGVFLHVEVRHPDGAEPDISGHQLTTEAG